MSEFQLIAQTQEHEQMIRLQLNDAHGSHLAAAQVQVTASDLAQWEGVFDPRRYVELYAGTQLCDGQTQPVTEDELLEEIGRFLGEKVLQPQIMGRLQGTARRTLTVILPDPQTGDLAAALARVPWEIARTSTHPTPLMAQNVAIRQTLQAGPPASTADDAGGTVRVLLVFAEAPGSHPLAMRAEREELLDLFFDRILPEKQVEVEVLCHGVTRSRLIEQITTHGGYHIVHWSGHGHQNLLELHPEPNQKSRLTGQELVGLLVQAGGFIPRLIFLSACHSAAVAPVKDWASFHAVVTGRRALARQADERKLPALLAAPSGYTGTALELLNAGVAEVIAMRHEVGDEYARLLAQRFYGRLLADPAHYSCENALELARGELLRDRQLASSFSPVDHATPVLFGTPQPAFQPQQKRSPQHARRFPEPQPLLSAGNRELVKHPAFVGRSAELVRLAGEWLPAQGPAVALVQGLAGLGKTALAAEAIHLWHARFDFVFCFQAKPTPLSLDEFYRQLDLKLLLASGAYRAKCDRSPYEKVFLPQGQPLPGPARFERLRNNLVNALLADRLLLVLDNFDTNLETIAGPDGYRCQDPEWDRLLAELAQGLPGSGSRLLITSRHRLAALAHTKTTAWVPLGPLPMAEAAQYVRSHEALRKLYFSDEAGRELAQRLLEVSRGHPLILNRLAALAGDRPALTGALEKLAAKGGWGSLPELFAGAKSADEREAERHYLEDIGIGAVDLLLERASADARRLLWIITLANEPVTRDLIEGVWSGWSAEEEGLEQALELAPRWPEDKRKELRAWLATENGRKRLAALERRKAASQALPVEPLLEALHRAGLIAREGQPGPGPDLGNLPEEAQAGLAALQRAMAGQATYSFHELVRERAAAWMSGHPDERGRRTESEVWIAYGERYARAFWQLQASGQQGAMEQATEAGRQALSYLLRARAFDRLGSFASALVTGTRSPAALRGVIEELQAVANQAPPGEDRWSVWTYLADALSSSGRSDESLPFYQQALFEAEAAQDWSDIGAICQNRACALVYAGQLAAAKVTFLRSAEAKRRAGAPEVEMTASDLEALRIDVKQGLARETLPRIEALLAKVRQWWQRHRGRETLPEAPDPVALGRALVSALDVAVQANLALERWQAGLNLLEELERAERDMGQSEHELAMTRFNQYGPLRRLGRLDDAQRVVESCLLVLREEGDTAHEAIALGALAAVWDIRGNLDQAVPLQRQALSLCNTLPDPSDRAISHNNLASYLERTGRPEESAQHDLAAGIYFLVCGHGQHLSTWQFSLRVRIQANRQYQLPSVSTLLSQPQFTALRQFLEGRKVNVAQLQAQIDQLIAQARREVA